MFVGALIPVITDVFRGQLERKQRIRDRRHDFQRESLMALQDTLIDMITSGGGVIAERQASERETGEWRVEISDTWRIDLLHGITGTRKQFVRVNDQQTRDLANETLDAVFLAVVSAKSLEEAEVAWEQALDAHLRSNERIGELLRML